MNFRNADGIWTVIAVVSFGPSSCARGIPPVFTRIQSHLDWINAIKQRVNRIVTTATVSQEKIMIGHNSLSTKTEKSFNDNANFITVPISILIMCVIISFLLS